MPPEFPSQPPTLSEAVALLRSELPAWVGSAALSAGCVSAAAVSALATVAVRLLVGKRPAAGGAAFAVGRVSAADGITTPQAAGDAAMSPMSPSGAASPARADAESARRFDLMATSADVPDLMARAAVLGGAAGAFALIGLIGPLAWLPPWATILVAALFGSRFGMAIAALDAGAKAGRPMTTAEVNGWWAERWAAEQPLLLWVFAVLEHAGAGLLTSRTERWWTPNDEPLGLTAVWVAGAAVGVWAARPWVLWAMRFWRGADLAAGVAPAGWKVMRTATARGGVRAWPLARVISVPSTFGTLPAEGQAAMLRSAAAREPAAEQALIAGLWLVVGAAVMAGEWATGAWWMPDPTADTLSGTWLLGASLLPWFVVVSASTRRARRHEAWMDADPRAAAADAEADFALRAAAVEPVLETPTASRGRNLWDRLAAVRMASSMPMQMQMQMARPARASQPVLVWFLVVALLALPTLGAGAGRVGIQFLYRGLPDDRVARMAAVEAGTLSDLANALIYRWAGRSGINSERWPVRIRALEVTLRHDQGSNFDRVRMARTYYNYRMEADAARLLAEAVADDIAGRGPNRGDALRDFDMVMLARRLRAAGHAVRLPPRLQPLVEQAADPLSDRDPPW